MKQSPIIIWTGTSHEGYPGRAIFDGEGVVFEQTRYNDGMGQPVWQEVYDTPREFLVAAAKAILIYLERP